MGSFMSVITKFFCAGNYLADIFTKNDSASKCTETVKWSVIGIAIVLSCCLLCCCCGGFLYLYFQMCKGEETRYYQLVDGEDEESKTSQTSNPMFMMNELKEKKTD